MILSETVFPASLMRLTMSECDLLVMEQLLTASIRSPTFSLPQRSAGLPSMMRPILWGMATHVFPTFVSIHVDFLKKIDNHCIDLRWKVDRKDKRGEKRENRFSIEITAVQSGLTELIWHQSHLVSLKHPIWKHADYKSHEKRSLHPIFIPTHAEHLYQQ